MKKQIYIVPDLKQIEMMPQFVIASSVGTEDLNEIPGSWDSIYY